MIDFKDKIAEETSKVLEFTKEELKEYIEIPKDTKMGDYALPCFKLAKEMKKSPVIIANEIKEKIELPNKYISKIEAVNGFLNIFINNEILIENVLDEEKEIVPGRGVLSTTTINLPRIALKHKNSIEDFFSELEQKMDLVKDQLLERLEIQGNKKVFNFPFLMKQNVWIDSEKLKEEDKVKKILKQGIMKISFLGLNECLIVLKEKNHGESKSAQELGLQIVEIMRKKTDEFSRKYNLNFMLAGENDMRIAKEFIEVDRVIFGKVENVTNKEHYTASFELPKNYDLDKKIKIEAPYHELTNGGHMIEVETNESVLNAVNKMFGKEIGLAKINFYN